MQPRADSYDLGRLRLHAGEGRRVDLEVVVEPFELGGQHYRVRPDLVPVRLDISRMTASGYALRVRLQAALVGPCMRCLEPATPAFSIDAREISQPGELDELDSPYLVREVLDVRAWVRDALALALPAQLLCSDDCPGLCPVCGVALGAAGTEHHHEAAPDPRWEKLSELRFE